MTKPQKQTLAFANKYKWWHSFATDKATTDVVFQLTNKGLLQVNEYRQFRITPKGAIV
jgi:hypothetical protein|tara:strand:+ start:60 stop:233 length:174 start_codon:yes stop_codon:yes gene_type:complete